MTPQSEPEDSYSVDGDYDDRWRSPDVAVTEVPILIVGGDPSGLLQAHMLSQLGGVHIILPILKQANHTLPN
jgi:hypothetical protein